LYNFQKSADEPPASRTPTTAAATVVVKAVKRLRHNSDDTVDDSVSNGSDIQVTFVGPSPAVTTPQTVDQLERVEAWLKNNACGLMV
jgi:hypothetical protein